MPELPEVETWRRLAHKTGVGRRITKAYAADDRIIFDQNDPEKVAKQLQNALIKDTQRRGKHFWLCLDRDPAHLYIHFGMTGSLTALSPHEEEPSHLKLRLTLDDGTRLVYRNMRRIGKIRLLEDATAIPPVSKLGPDPVEDSFTAESLQEKLQRRKGPIKAVLLNQAVFAGVGNWIADEVLFQSRLSPHRRCCDLSEKEIRTLHRCLNRILARAIDDGADASRFPKTWLFHRRWGKKARQTAQGEAIQFDQVGGRTTAWVPSRQS